MMKMFSAAVLVLSLHLPSLSHAQSKSATCHVNTEKETPAQIKNDRFEFKEAAALFEAELKVDPKNASLRAAQIRNLADMDRLDEAYRLSTAFVAEDATSGIALTAKAYVLFKQGHLAESYALNASSQKLDPCQARVYLYLADYERSIAMWKNAWDHIQLAHKLDPLNDDIAHDWIAFLPRKESLEARRSYVQTSNAVTEPERKLIVEQVDKALATAPTPRGCRPQGVAQSTQVKFSDQVVVPGELIRTVPLKINGKTKHLILDTGAPGLALTAVAAANLGLKIEAKGFVGGFGDEKPAAAKATHLHSVQIGTVEFTDCEALIVSGLEGSADGLLGGDVFREFLLTLDYPNEHLSLDPLPELPDRSPTASKTLYSSAGDVDDDGTVHYRNRYIPPSMAAWTPFYLVGSQILIPTQIEQSAPLLFLVDTGSDFTMVKPSAVRPLTKLQESSDAVYGVSGAVKNTYRTGPLLLHFGSLFQPMSSILAVDRIPSTGSTDVSGVLGMPTWRQVTLHLDYRDHLMKVEFARKK